MTEFTPAEREAIRSLAEAALVERLGRAYAIGHTPTGRIIAEYRGEPGPAETAWFALGRKLRAER